MTHFQCEALTLRTYPFAEGDKIAVFLTRSEGLVRGVAYGAKSPRGRFGSSLEPLTHLMLSFRRKENQELATIEGCEIIRALPMERLNWEQSLFVGFLAEILMELVREQQESEREFRLALAVLDSIEKVPVRLLAAYTELWLLRLEGVLPRLDRRLPQAIVEKVEEIFRRSPRDLKTIEISADEVDRLEKVAAELVEYHLEKPLKARRFLNQQI